MEHKNHSGRNRQSANSAEPKLLRVLVLVTAVLALVGAWTRARNGGSWDQIDETTLLYLLVPIAVLLVGSAKSLTFGKEGFIFERMDELATRVDEQEEELGAVRSAAVHHVGRHPALMQSAQTGELEATDSNERRQPTARPEDPNKGQFGGSASGGGWALSAEIRKIPGAAEWFGVHLTVRPDVPREGEGRVVRFHLHPTFREPVVDVQVQNGVASIERVAWGAFTVGAEIGAIRLELDLSLLSDAPIAFRSR